MTGCATTKRFIHPTVNDITRQTEGGIIADIVKYADSQSSSYSLSNLSNSNNNTATSTTQATPISLADKLLSTMRYLVLETKIKINTPGAIAYTTPLEQQLGKDFMHWLISTVNQKQIAINTVNAKIHIVLYKQSKALFLVSPKIFKEYDIDKWARVQKHFGRLKINLKTNTNENIWQVQTKTRRQHQQGSRIKGYLIVNPEKHGFKDLLDANKHLDLLVPTD